MIDPNYQFPFHSEIVQRAVRRLLRELSESGIRMEVSQDFSGLKTVYLELPEKNAFHLGFDPDLHGSIEGGWISGATERRRPVVSVAARRFKNDSFVELLRSLRIWYPHGREPAEGDSIELHLDPESLAHVSGNLAVGGLLWVHPELRGQGVSGWLHDLIEAWMLGMYDFDYYVVVTDPGLVKAGVVSEKYRFFNMHFGTRWRRRGGFRDYWIAYNSRKDVLRKLSIADGSA